MELALTLLYLSAAVGLCVFLSHDALRGAVCSALGVIMVLALVLPLVRAVRDIASSGITLPDRSADSDGFAELTREAFEEGVAIAIRNEYGLPLTADGVSARGFSATDMLADGITVVLPAGSEWTDYREMRDFVAENFTRGGFCEVIYG